MRVTLSQLRVFEAVVRTKSLSRAAEELGIKQPSASTQLRALETGCRSRLLHRQGHDLKPARLASLILPQVRALVSLAAEIDRILEEEAQLRSGVLSIGYSTYQYAMPLISRFIATYPDVKIEARSMSSLDLLELLDRGEIDLALITAQEPPPRLRALRLLTADIVLALPEDHPLAARGTASWEEIAELSIVRREPSSNTRRIFDDAARRAGVTLNRVLDLGSWGSLRAAVETGIGCCVALRGEVEASDRVAVLKIDDPGLWAGHYAVCAPEMQDVAAVSAFFALAEEGS